MRAKCEKSRHARLDKYIISWQECQFWNRIFEGELSKVDVAEIRQLIDGDSEVGEEGKQC